MKIFGKRMSAKSYDKEDEQPIIRASICNGEQVVGFKNKNTGEFTEVMLIKNPADLADFKEQYGIEEEIGKEY